MSELKRLTPPYLTPRDEADAVEYWSQQQPSARSQANSVLMREFCLERGIDIDKPGPRTIAKRTLGEPDLEAEQWDRDFDAFLRRR